MSKSLICRIEDLENKPDLDEQNLLVNCDELVLEISNGDSVALEDLGNLTGWRLAPIVTPGVRNREWHDTAPVVPIADSTTAAGRAFRISHDFSLPTTTNTTITNLNLNDTDDTAVELDVQVLDTFITVPVGGVWVQYDGGSEGYWAIEVGYCCGPLELADELGYSDRENASAIVGPVFLPEGQHAFRAWNIDSGGTNSSHVIRYSTDGTTFSTAVPSGVEFSLDCRATECQNFPACGDLPDGWTECPPVCTAPIVDPAPVIPEEEVDLSAIEITCSQANSLQNAGSLEPGREYLVTDYNRGTVGAAQILTHAVTATALAWDVSVLTKFDDSAWMARWNPDTCRIIDMFDNLGNKVRSDNGDEIERFPWGNALVSGNDFTDVGFTYTAGTVRDNVGDPTSVLIVSGGSITQTEIGPVADVRISGGTIDETKVGSGARLYVDGEGFVSETVVDSDSYLDTNLLQIRDSRLSARSQILGDGATGRIDRSSFDSASVDVRNSANVDFDELSITSNGRVLGNSAARIHLDNVEITSNAYVQATANGELEINNSKVISSGLITSTNGVLLVNNTSVSDISRIQQSSNGSNRVDNSQLDSYGRVFFQNAADNNRLNYGHVDSLGMLRFRGTTNGAIVERSKISSQGYIDLLNDTNAVMRYDSVADLGYIILNGNNGVNASYSSLSGYGRMLVQGGSTGRILGVTIEGTAYVRLTNHASDLRYSSFDSYFYYYLTNNTAIKQGLSGSGRQSYTEPNPGATVTGPGVRNW